LTRIRNSFFHFFVFVTNRQTDKGTSSKNVVLSSLLPNFKRIIKIAHHSFMWEREREREREREHEEVLPAKEVIYSHGGDR